MVELAHAQAHARDAIASVRGIAPRCAGATWAHQDVTTLEIYTLPIPAHQREAVERLSQLVTNGDELHHLRGELPGHTEQIQ